MQMAKEIIWKNVDENRQFVAKKKEQHELDEQIESTNITIMKEMGKRVAKLKKLKEMEVRR